MFNNLLATYYQKKKEKLHKSAREIYQDFPGEEKLKKYKNKARNDRKSSSR